MAYQWTNGAPKVAFITGGGSGLGRQFARLLLGEGASVALLDLHVSDEVMTEMQALAGPGQQVRAYTLNVTDAKATEAAVTQAVADLGAPDLAINSAGVAISRPFRDLEQADFERVVSINLFGSRNFAAAMLPKMAKGGRLALVASMAGKVGTYGYGAYAASKFGVVGLAEVLRMEEMLNGIDISVICPGEVNTPLVAAEAIDIHPIARAVKDLGGTIEPEEACDQIMAQLARGKFVIIPGRDARRTAWLARFLPGVLQRTIDKTVLRTARDVGLV